MPPSTESNDVDLEEEEEEEEEAYPVINEWTTSECVRSPDKAPSIYTGPLVGSPLNRRDRSK